MSLRPCFQSKSIIADTYDAVIRKMAILLLFDSFRKCNEVYTMQNLIDIDSSSPKLKCQTITIDFRAINIEVENGLLSEFSPALPFVRSPSVSLFFPSVGSTHPS